MLVRDWLLVCFCFSNGVLGLVNRFLSWKPFIPLSRLTYCAYLVNGFIEVYSFASLRQGTYMSIFEMVRKLICWCT